MRYRPFSQCHCMTNTGFANNTNYGSPRFMHVGTVMSELVTKSVRSNNFTV